MLTTLVLLGFVRHAFGDVAVRWAVQLQSWFTLSTHSTTATVHTTTGTLETCYSEAKTSRERQEISQH